MTFSHLKYRSTKCGSDLQKFKLDENLLENLRLQISVISRQQTPSMLVSIGAQHSRFRQVLLPILSFTPFVVTYYWWPDHSQNSCHKQLELLILLVQEKRVYGYKLNFSKSVILLIYDSVSDEGRDLLENILPNKMIRKLNLILLLIWNFLISRYGKLDS